MNDCKFAVMAVVGKYHYQIADKMFTPPVFYETRALGNDAMEHLVIDKYNCISDTTICRDRRAKTLMSEEDDYDYQDITEVKRFYVKAINKKLESK